MIYRADLPGVGAVYIQAGSPYDAAILWQDRFLRQMGMRLAPGTIVPPPIEVAGAPAGTPPERIIGSVPALPQQPADPPADTAQSGQSGSQGNGNSSGSGNSTAGGSGQNSDAMPLWRIVGGGVVIYVEAQTADRALAAAQSYLNREGIRLEEGTALGAPQRVETGLAPAGSDPIFVIDEVGNSLPGRIAPDTEDQQQGPDDSGEDAQSRPEPLGPPPLIVKVVLPNRQIRFVRVNTANSNEAREAAQRHFGPEAYVASAVGLDYYLQHRDDDFVAFWDMLRGEGSQSYEEFLDKLEVIELGGSSSGQPGDDGDNGDGSDGGDDGGDNSGDPGTEPLPQDIQDFPLPTFQNALEALGYDPNGVIGGLLNQRYNDILPAFEIGSFTGTFDPIGNAPGALQSFFETQFGNLGLAADVFRDLIAGNAASGLNGQDLVALQAFANPDFGTYDGPGKAGVVLDLAQAAAADRFGSFIARNLLPSNQRLLNEYERLIAAAGGVPELSFLEFARQQNLLPAEF